MADAPRATVDQSIPLWLIDVRERSEVAREGMIPKSLNLPLGELKNALLADCEDFGQKYGFPKPEKHHENVVFYRDAFRSGRGGVGIWKCISGGGWKQGGKEGGRECETGLAYTLCRRRHDYLSN